MSQFSEGHIKTALLNLTHVANIRLKWVYACFLAEWFGGHSLHCWGLYTASFHKLKVTVKFHYKMCYKAEQLSTANCQSFNTNEVFTSRNYSLLFVCQVHFRYPLPFLLMISFLFPQWLWSPSSKSYLTFVTPLFPHYRLLTHSADEWVRLLFFCFVLVWFGLVWFGSCLGTSSCRLGWPWTQIRQPLPPECWD